jgi:branched-subunit amino acid aminotransferase/4-amino-4-deoxychorismate lyase
MQTLFIDGTPATEADLAHQALVNYGAYTSFRVEDGGVRGLDLHLARLENAATELFGQAIGHDRLRALIRTALGTRQRAWLRISLFSNAISNRDPTAHGDPRVMIGVFDPPLPLADTVRVQLQIYEREAPHIKHVATFGLLRARRAAKAAGFDDALFVDRDGRISEGSLWNIGFLSGDTIVWPQAPMLVGVTQALLSDGLQGRGIDQSTRPVTVSELSGFDAVFLCNSATPAASITAIGDHVFNVRPDLIDRLHDVWRATPRQAL